MKVDQLARLSACLYEGSARYFWIWRCTI